MTTKESLEIAIRALLEKTDHCSFVEIERELDRLGLEYSGQLCIHLPEYENIILWAGMSKDYTEAIRGLMKDFCTVPCSPLVYMIDGKCLTFPLVKSLRQYRTEHWQSCVFRSRQAFEASGGWRTVVKQSKRNRLGNGTFERI